MDINQKLLAAFQVEHVEHLEAIRGCLAHWAQEGDTPNVDEAFRRAHSLKGAARVTGLLPVENLAHHLENLFAMLRSRSISADRAVIHSIDLALDVIEDSAGCLLQGNPPPDASGILRQLDGLLAAGTGTKDQAPGETRENSVEDALGALPAAALAAETVSPAEPRSSPTKFAGQALVPGVDTVRLSTGNLDRLLQSTGRLLTESMHQDALARELSAISQQLGAIQCEWDSLKRTTAGPLRRLSATPELAGLSKYVELVEHEVHALLRNVRTASQLQQRSSWSVRLLAEQLQDDMCHARMVPAGTELQGFRKMMRDLARDQGKELEFRVFGFEVLADRMVLQSLKDPLMHVLRNAVTHGIESPPQRDRQGKPATGAVTLTLQVIGNRLTIEVEDDGRGVDAAHVARVAVRNGMLSEAEAAGQSPAELARLLFQPGFSTSANVTAFSGRGMGLSAVYEAVTHLQGDVELRPRSPAGSSILISVPLSISTHRLLLVSCRGQTLALPFYGIDALHSLPVHAIEAIEGIPMVSLGGQLMPLVSLAALLDDSQAEFGVEAETLSLAVLHSGSKRVAVAVDAFISERNSLIKNLGPPANADSTFMGGTLLEDGSVSLVVNPANLIERYRPSKKAAIRAAVRSTDERRPSTVLVVDDSFTTRTLETSILETNGFRVRVAVDGVDALEQLRSETADLVITDIQMPKLDGFGLLEEIKRDPRLARIPVIIVSSVDGTDDQERGLSLGADAYIAKRRFDHQELLKTVRQIL